METVHSADGCIFVTHPKRAVACLTSGAGDPHLDSSRNIKRSSKTAKRSGRNEIAVPLAVSVHKMTDNRAFESKGGYRGDPMKGKYLLRLR